MIEEKLNNITEEILRMAALAEEMVKLSVRAIVEKKMELTDKVINELEPQVNELEIKIDNLAIETLALYTPQAKNLRKISMIIKW